MEGGILQEDTCLQNDFFLGLLLSKLKIMEGGILQENTSFQNDFYGSVIQQTENHGGGYSTGGPHVSRMTFMGILQDESSLQNDFYGSLCTLDKDKPSDWDKHLDAVMFGLRTKRQMTTKFSPYYLMFEREARYPSEIPEVYQIDKSVEGTLSIEEMTESAIAISEALTEARINTRASQERIRRQTKDKKGLNKFKVGDRV
ncbi:myosin-1 isoform X3 [Labeo rohita]|uniref:Myosin-1 isoform X3 n=1 Tax=Labeo rohita TaxID=84645 RepID=A0A498M274_LABRO|nr:myosin-1 isoform X3 [Labeo rohita]